MGNASGSSSPGLVFVHSSDERYGADRVLLDLFEALSADERRGAEFWLPTDVPHGEHPLCRELRRRGAIVRHVDLPILRRAYISPRKIGQMARRLATLAREFRKAQPQAVYCTTSAAFLAAPVARLCGIDVTVGHVQELWGRLDRVAMEVLARSCRSLIVISGPVRDQMTPSLRSRASVVLNATTRPESEQPLAGRSGDLHFVIASRWNGWKGHGTLLRAWDRLDEPGTLTILGGPPGSGVATDVRQLCEGLRVPGSVRVLGEVTDVDSYLTEADVVLVPSDAPEPFGLVAIEAFARGRPVVGSRGGGLAEIVTHGVDGWLFAMQDSQALADILSGLDRDAVNRAGHEARKTYDEKFTVERYAREWRRALPFLSSAT